MASPAKAAPHRRSPRSGQHIPALPLHKTSKVSLLVAKTRKGFSYFHFPGKLIILSRKQNHGSFASASLVLAKDPRMPDTDVLPHVSLSHPRASLSDQSGTLGHSAHVAAADMARVLAWPGGWEPTPAGQHLWYRKHTVPQASPQLSAQTLESRGSKLKTSSLQGACKV